MPVVRMHTDARRTHTDPYGCPSDPYGSIRMPVGPIRMHTEAHGTHMDPYGCLSDRYGCIRMPVGSIRIHTDARRTHTDPYGCLSDRYCSSHNTQSSNCELTRFTWHLSSQVGLCAFRRRLARCVCIVSVRSLACCICRFVLAAFRAAVPLLLALSG